jgi:hypothetical protein
MYISESLVANATIGNNCGVETTKDENFDNLVVQHLFLIK